MLHCLLAKLLKIETLLIRAHDTFIRRWIFWSISSKSQYQVCVCVSPFV